MAWKVVLQGALYKTFTQSLENEAMPWLSSFIFNLCVSGRLIATVYAYLPVLVTVFREKKEKLLQKCSDVLNEA